MKPHVVLFYKKLYNNKVQSVILLYVFQNGLYFIYMQIEYFLGHVKERTGHTCNIAHAFISLNSFFLRMKNKVKIVNGLMRNSDPNSLANQSLVLGCYFAQHSLIYLKFSINWSGVELSTFKPYLYYFLSHAS